MISPIFRRLVTRNELRGAAREKVFHPLDELPFARFFLERSGIIARVCRVKLFLSSEGFDERAVMEPVIVKLEELPERCRHDHNAAENGGEQPGDIVSFTAQRLTTGIAAPARSVAASTV